MCCGNHIQKKVPRIKVSDHAYVRYLERVLKFDIEKLRVKLKEDHLIIQYLLIDKGIDFKPIYNAIVTKQLKEITRTLGGNGTYPNEREGGIKCVLVNYKIVTLYEANYQEKEALSAVL